MTVLMDIVANRLKSEEEESMLKSNFGFAITRSNS